MRELAGVYIEHSCMAVFQAGNEADCTTMQQQQLHLAMAIYIKCVQQAATYIHSCTKQV